MTGHDCNCKDHLEKNVMKQLLKKKYEYRDIDGSNSNPNGYGKSNNHFRHLAPQAYSDALNEPAGKNRPSARIISNEIFNQTQSIPNEKKATNFFWLWGQFIDHDITLAQTGNEQLPVMVPSGDPYFDPNSSGNKTISFQRSLYDPNTGINNIPREQINVLTPVIDASMIYGDTKKRSDFLRSFHKGELKHCIGNLMPFNDGSQSNAGNQNYAAFVGGDVRANEHIALASLHILFMREHNYWAKKIHKLDPKLNDEKIYQLAKIMVESEIQAITFNEFLPLLLGKNAVPKYDGYQSSVDMRTSAEFSTAAYRFGHSLIADNLYHSINLKLKDTFFSSHYICNNGGIDNILQIFTNTVCETIDGKVVNDLRNFLFGPPGAGGLDLVSLNIQRGRDHGVSDYNTVRDACGLKKYSSFDDINTDSQIKNSLANLYTDVNDIDLFTGGLVEKHYKDSMLGELFYKIIFDQFMRFRSGDRLWYEHRLTRDQIKYINSIKLSDIIKRNTNIHNIQKYVFVLPK